MPVLLRPDNWTSPERTPWGGRAILERLKRGLDIPADKRAWPAIGESWELSFDPAMPSRDHAGTTLSEHIAADPRGWLGEDAGTAERARSFLVKLLDAKEALSVQVHPADGDPDLAAHESGKPEAWIVLAREPGAGLWLGVREGVTRASFERALDASGEVDHVRELLNFVPVEVGDAFVIDAGTVHAVGAGVTLLEPQLVQPGKSGVTYRFWDWGRRFHGVARPLHRERSLAVTAWHAPVGEAFVTSCRRTPVDLVQPLGAVRHQRYFEFKGMRVDRLSGDGAIDLPAGCFRALLLTQGEADIAGAGETLTMRSGECLVVPASVALRSTLRACEAWVVAVVGSSQSW